MDLGAYLIGCALLVAVALPIAYAAWSVRACVMPHWSHAPARLVEIVIALSTIVVVAEFLGSFHWLRRAPFVIVVDAVSFGLVVLARRVRARSTSQLTVTSGSAIDTARAPVFEVAAATIALAFVASQWAGKVGYAVDHGMTHPDTLWYHGPYAATFAQRGYTLGYLDKLDPLHSFAGHTSELLHGILMLLLGRDVLSPFVNVAWAALALFAAWSIGRRRRVGALCVLGATFVLGLPTIQATHPGQASNDVATAALMLTSLAILFEGHLALAPTTIAGLAAGLALSMKVTASLPVIALTLGVIVLARRRERLRIAAGWCGALVLTGSYWFIRNIVVVHNPVPYYNLHFGLFTIHAVPQRHPGSVSNYLFRADVWRKIFRPGFRTALGHAWPFVLFVILAGAVVMLFRGRPSLQRLAGVVAVMGIVGYLFTPYTADGFAFKFNVRYATAAFLVSVVLLMLWLADRPYIVRYLVATLLVVLVVVSWRSINLEDVPTWPDEAHVLGPLAALLVVGIVVGSYVLHRKVRLPDRRVLGAIAAVAVVAAVYPLQRHALERRYVDTGLPLGDVYAALRPVHDAHVAYFGTNGPYPFFGSSMTNHLQRPLIPPNTPCNWWIGALKNFDYIVVGRADPYALDRPPESAIKHDKHVATIVSNDKGSLYRLTAPLAGNDC